MGSAPSPFPRGVADPERSTGFVSLADDEIVAVDLDSGDVRWRATGVGRPLLPTAAGLLVVRRGAEGIELVLADAATGEMTVRLGELPVPDWAAAEWAEPGGFVAVARHEAAPEVTWRAVRRYHGGAPPSHELAREIGSEAGGVVEVDLEAGRLAARAEDGPTGLDDELGGMSFNAVETADRTYTLDVRPADDGSSAVTLAATQHGAAGPLWETVLDRRAPRRPPHLRP
jgi:hypothetical protein